MQGKPDAASAHPVYDFIVCGSGPAGSAFTKTILEARPGANVLLLERGPLCKTDVLTERNPFRLLRDSNRIVSRNSHGVVQGNVLGGGTSINNYAWVTPSFRDIKSALGLNANALGSTTICGAERMFESILGPRQVPHLLHQLITSWRPPDTPLVTNDQIKVELTNRGKIFIGSPSITSDGKRRSAFTGLIESLWRKYFGQLTILPDTSVTRILFEPTSDESTGAVQLIRANAVETSSGEVFYGDKIVLAAGAIESPAILMRSGIGPAKHLKERSIPVLLANEHVGQHLKDKMLLDDMIITDNSCGDFDNSLMLVNRIFDDGVSVQLHRYDKFTVGNTYLAMSRLIRAAWQDAVQSHGTSVIQAFRCAMQYLNPVDYSALCFQTYVKMTSEAQIRLSSKDKNAVLDASALFSEVFDRERELTDRVASVYTDIQNMRDKNRISYQTVLSGLGVGQLASHFRLVWHFAGSCRVRDVVDPTDFSVLGTKDLHIVDMSTCRETSDGGTMAMAYLTGHIAASQMLLHSLDFTTKNICD